MKLRSLALCLAVAAALPGCQRKQPPKAVAGVYALKGRAELKKPGTHFVRSAKPGMLVTNDMELEVAKGEIALEGLNGARIALGEGKHKLALMEQFEAPPIEKRKVVAVGSTAEEKEVAGLIVAPRYEPIDSGKIKGEKDDTAESARWFLSIHKDGEELPDPGPEAPPPPWVATDYVHGLTRPLTPGDGQRQLVSAKGGVVVEFQDHATAFATALTLPLDLHDVTRVVVIYGSAKLKLADGKTVELSEGQEAEIGKLPGAAAAAPQEQ